MPEDSENRSAADRSGTPRYIARVPDGQRTPTPKPAENAAAPADPEPAEPSKKKEIGGPKGPEPTRFGDWERDGRCVDF